MPYTLSSTQILLGRKELGLNYTPILDGPLSSLNDLLEILHEAASAIGQEHLQKQFQLEQLHPALKELTLSGNYNGYLKDLIESEGAFARSSDQGKDLPLEEYWTYGNIPEILDQISQQIQYDLRALRRMHQGYPYMQSHRDPKLSKLEP